jgi:putative phage-type endonuclease
MLLEMSRITECGPMKREVREITDTSEWLAWRREFVTASRIGALFGCHPHLTMDALVSELHGRRRMPEDNAAMRRGRILEPAVFAALQEEHPEWNDFRKANTFHLLPEHRLGCTPDAFIADNGLVEIKTVSPHKWEEWRAHPPPCYILQTLCELLVTGRERGILAVMVCSPSYPVYEFEVPRHAAAEQRILDAVAEFWRAWDAGGIAAPAPADDIAAMLDDGSHKDMSGDNAMPALLSERAELKAAINAAERRLKEIEYEIKNRIGPARTAYVPGWMLSYKSQMRKEHVIPAATARVLRIKAMVEESNDE